MLGVQGLAHQALPEGGQQVQRQGHVGADGDAQQLAQEVQQLLVGVADGTGRQDVLPLGRAGRERSAGKTRETRPDKTVGRIP